MSLIETRISEVKPGDEWYFEGAWVAVDEVWVGYPDDRVTIAFHQDGDLTGSEQTSAYLGFEVAIVKRP